ncbi:VOC family protein, partial [Synechococcus sp. AH-551-N17]|nr:VOC family protein [Synechococcus sp. AH-551-N17]
MSAEKASLSWVLAANNPQSLAEFYAKALGCSCRAGLSDQHWMVSLPTGGTLQIYCPSRQRPWPVRGAALSPCFQRIGTDHPETELGGWIQQLEALGARRREAARLESFGAECWMEDP